MNQILYVEAEAIWTVGTLKTITQKTVGCWENACDWLIEWSVDFALLGNKFFYILYSYMLEKSNRCVDLINN